MASDSPVREMWEKKTNRAYEHSFPVWMEWIDFIRGAAAGELHLE
jgi:hypothetical protein